VVAGRSRTRTGRLSKDMLCRGLEKNGIVGARHGHGMASLNQTRPHCVNQMGKIHSKPFSGTAWHGHGMVYVNRPYEDTNFVLEGFVNTGFVNNWGRSV
jgi:hypothetical protein